MHQLRAGCLDLAHLVLIGAAALYHAGKLALIASAFLGERYGFPRLRTQLLIPSLQQVNQRVLLINHAVGCLDDHGHVGGQQALKAADGGLGRTVRHLQDVADLGGQGGVGQIGGFTGGQLGFLFGMFGHLVSSVLMVQPAWPR